MKISDSKVPCQQLLTLSLEGGHGLHVLLNKTRMHMFCGSDYIEL